MDYRDVSFSFAGRRRRRRRRLLRITLGLPVILLLGVLVALYRAHRPLDRAADLLARGDWKAAQSLLHEQQGRLFFRERRDELAALTGLFTGHRDETRAELARLEARGVRGRVDPVPLLAQLAERGLYPEMQILLDHLAQRTGDDLSWHGAIAAVGLYNARGARECLARLSGPFRERNSKALALLTEALAALERGTIPCVFDRSGRLLASWLPREKRLVFAVSGLVLPEIAGRLKESFAYVFLTIDREEQERAARVFSGQYGSLLVLSVPEGSVRVAFSNPRPPQQGDSALHQRFEPGSVIKVLSLAAFLRGSPSPLFPFKCSGVLEIDGKPFYDWLPHRGVESPEQALALSCNLSFARIGLSLGSEAIEASLRRFSFNAPPLADPLFQLEMGTFSPPPWPPIRLASLAVGLGEIRLTAIHGALLAAWVAQDGQVDAPHLVDHVENVFKLGTYSAPPRPLPRLDLAGAGPRLRQAMARVVEDEDGTARRARLPGLRMGVKTGTVGDRERGFDAILIGFFPLEKPGRAFCLRLDGAGKAELAGAQALRAYLADDAGGKP